MPSATSFALFCLASAALAVVPGPAVTYIVMHSVDKGRRAGLASAVGVASGGLVHVAAATVGLSALIASSATAFTVVKLVGAAYLIVVGSVASWPRRRGDRCRPSARAAPPPVPPGRDRQRLQPEDGALLPRVPAAVRRRTAASIRRRSRYSAARSRRSRSRRTAYALLADLLAGAAAPQRPRSAAPPLPLRRHLRRPRGHRGGGARRST